MAAVQLSLSRECSKRTYSTISVLVLHFTIPTNTFDMGGRFGVAWVLGFGIVYYGLGSHAERWFVERKR